MEPERIIVIGGTRFVVKSDVEIPEIFLRMILSGMPFIRNNSINLGSAHFKHFDVSDFIPVSEIQGLDDVLRHYQLSGSLKARDAQKMNRFPVVVRDILLSETSLRPPVDHIYGIEGSTRDALDILFSHIAARDGKPLAIPLPSWHFWSLLGPRDAYRFSYFDAQNEEQLVGNFARQARKENIGALVLTNPANPLQYSLSESAAREIDNTALRHGIEIVIDDVLRGTFPTGKRDSVARFFTRPYVVEGLSKRFGDYPLGEFSYILAPENISLNAHNLMGGDRELINSTFVSLAYKHVSDKALDELLARNTAFDAGLRQTCPQAEITRPCDSFLTSLVHLPNSNGRDFFQRLVKEAGIYVSPIDAFYPDGSSSSAPDNLIRITIGHYHHSQLNNIGERFGKSLAHEYSNRT